MDYFFSKLVGKLRYLKDTLVNRAIGCLLKWAVKQRQAPLAARLLNLSMATLKKAAPSHSKPLTTLILGKSGLTEDVLAALGTSNNFIILSIPRMHIKEVFLGFLPVSIQDNNYRFETEELQKKRLELRAFWEEIVRRLSVIKPIHLVITGNFSYAAEQELTVACEELGVRFVALHKECLNTPALAEFYQNVYHTHKSQFRGSKILVYNSSEAGIMLGSGIAQDNQVSITGMPRMDALHQWRRSAAGRGSKNRNQRPCLVLFSFNEKTGMPWVGDKTSHDRRMKMGPEYDGLSISTLVEDCHKVVWELAEENAELEVFIKTKANMNGYKTLNQVYGPGYQKRVPSNLKIIHGGDPLPLLIRADAILSFNSTTLLEGLAAGKAVVQPRYAEAIDPAITPYVIDLGQAALYADTRDELKQKLLDCCQSPPPPLAELNKAQIDALIQYVGNPDGAAGERVRQIIEDLTDR
jgi:hypothetical protein